VRHPVGLQSSSLKPATIQFPGVMEFIAKYLARGPTGAGSQHSRQRFAQFKDTNNQVILTPARFKTDEVIYPMANARR
jgi:hypothetical protein